MRCDIDIPGNFAFPFQAMAYDPKVYHIEFPYHTDIESQQYRQNGASGLGRNLYSKDTWLRPVCLYVLGPMHVQIREPPPIKDWHRF